jgi:hypothetical protein
MSAISASNSFANVRREMLRFLVMFVRELYQMTTKDRTLHVQNKDRKRTCSERALKRRVVSREQDEQAEIAAVQKRLKAFTKPVKNYHDPERLARWRDLPRFSPTGETRTNVPGG